MSQELVQRPRPEDCTHLWNLALHLTGRRVALECARCETTDKEVWGPGGVADLVSMEWDHYAIDDLSMPPVTRIQVNGGQHTCPWELVVPVDLVVYQSIQVTGYRQFGRALSGPLTQTRVTVTLRD